MSSENRTPKSRSQANFERIQRNALLLSTASGSQRLYLLVKTVQQGHLSRRKLTHANRAHACDGLAAITTVAMFAACLAMSAM